MAIQNRRGNYGDFDKSKMLAGEFAIVLQDDPDTSDGKAAYIAFSPGSAKRLMTKEDLDEGIEEATQQVVDAIVASVEGLVGEAETAVTNAQDAADDASESASQAASVIPELNQDNATAGSAKQLLSKGYTEVKVPYHFKATKPDASADIGDREYLEIVGGSVGWNQLTKNGNFESNNEWTTRYANLSVNNNVASFTPSSSGTTRGIVQMNNTNPVQNGHKYFISVEINPSDSLSFSLSFGGASGKNTPALPANTWTKVGALWTYSNPSFNCNVAVYSGGTMTTEQSAQVRNVNSFDLTQMFGSTIADYLYTIETATAGAGVAKLKSWGFFTQDYYAYDAGSLKSVEGLESHETVGFNQWDEEWELGTIDVTTGQNQQSSGNIRSKNYIRVVPDTVYYHRSVSGIWMAVLTYDADKNFISNLGGISSGYTFTTPKNCAYIRFYMATTYGTTYNHDICINLHWTGYRDGEYQPYVKHSYPLDSSLTLRGIPKKDADGNLYYDGDVYQSDGTVQRRYGITHMGDMEWSDGGYYFYSSISGKANGNYNLICSKYVTTTGQSVSEMSDKQIKGHGTATNIYVRDSAYTDASAFKTSLNGCYLVYELATPTTETAEPFQSPQIVDDFGTEEFVTDSIVPVGHNTKYPANLRERIESIPVLPTTAGNYRLQVTIVSGKPVYEWVTT